MLEKLADRIAVDLASKDPQYDTASTNYGEREAGYHGKNLRLGIDKDCWFGVANGVWKDQGLTPLWWMMHKRFLDTETKQRLVDRFRDHVWHDSYLAIPIYLPAGEEEQPVIDFAIKQLMEIAGVLKGRSPSSDTNSNRFEKTENGLAPRRDAQP